MILRNAVAEAVGGGPVRPAWQVFLESQQGADTTGVVLQVAHSSLAGELAACLVAEALGELPPEVAEAAARHDLGWAESDERQLRETGVLKPFPEMKQDELPSWRRSLEMAESLGPLPRVLISRHFSALANQPSPEHEEFLRTETERRQEIERRLGSSEADLERWAGAVGLCDLLSLYLCAEVREPAIFPLAHPAAPQAKTARTFTVSWEDGRLVFSEPVFKSGSVVSTDALRVDESGERLPVSLRWEL